MTDLLPCPFCGGKADWYIATADLFAQQMGCGLSEKNSVECEGCGASSFEHKTRERAIKAWNTRTTPQPDTEKLHQY